MQNDQTKKQNQPNKDANQPKQPNNNPNKGAAPSQNLRDKEIPNKK